MTSARKYFHDRFVLFMLSVNGFLTVLSVLGVFFRLGDTEDDYITRYQANLGVLSGFERGGPAEIISFAVFAIIIFGLQFVISLRLYAVHKQAAWIVLALGSLLLALCLIVSSALLQLR